MSDKEKIKNKYKAPRRDDRTGYTPTASVLADTYDESLLAEMQETLTATVFAETFPEALDYKVPKNAKK